MKEKTRHEDIRGEKRVSQEEVLKGKSGRDEEEGRKGEEEEEGTNGDKRKRLEKEEQMRVERKRENKGDK